MTKDESYFRKSCCKTEDIIYDLFIDPLDYLNYNTLNLHPNTITTLSILCCILCLYYFKNNNYLSILFMIFYIILDFLDGYVARKYDKKTVFGDYFDHSRDIIFTSLLYLLIIQKIIKNKNNKISIFILCFIIIFYCIGLIPFSCNELSHTNNQSISIIFNLCKYNKYIPSFISNIFCIGNSLILTCIFMYYIIEQDKKLY